MAVQPSHRSTSLTNVQSSYAHSSRYDNDNLWRRDHSLDRQIDKRGSQLSSRNLCEDHYKWPEWRGSRGSGEEVWERLANLEFRCAKSERELEITKEKLGSSVHSIKTFWSPELKKERLLRKDVSTKLNDLLASQLSLGTPSSEGLPESKQVRILRKTIEEMELRIETQKQTLAARDTSVARLMEMLPSERGISGLRAQNQNLEKRYQDQTVRLEVLQEQLKIKEEQHSLFQIELESLRSKVDLQEKLKVTGQDDLVQGKEKVISSLQNMLKLNDLKIGELKDAVASGEKTVGELTRNLKKKEKQIASLSTVELCVSQKEEELKKFKAMRENMEDVHLEETSRLEKERKVLVEKISNLELKADELQHSILELREEASGLRTERLEQDRIVQQLKAQSERDAKKLREFESLAAEKAIVDEKLKECQAKIQNIKRQQVSEKKKTTAMFEEARRRELESSADSAQTKIQMAKDSDVILSLEEALKESLQIAAQRELEISEIEAQTEGKLEDMKRELAIEREESREHVKLLNEEVEAKRIQLKQWEHYYKDKINQLDEMKQDALVTSITEKDAHLALLETLPRSSLREQQMQQLTNEKQVLQTRLRELTACRMQTIDNVSLISKNKEVSEAKEDISGHISNHLESEIEFDVENNPLNQSIE